MTEAGWLSGTSAIDMLLFLRGQSSARKLRLFACSCCRRLWYLLNPESGQKAVEAAELYADRLIRKGALKVAQGMMRREAQDLEDRLLTDPADMARMHAAWAAWAVTATALVRDYQAAGRAARMAARRASSAAFAGSGQRNEPAAQCALLRDIIGNPFRRPTFDPAWGRGNNRKIVALAQAVYDGRRFEDLAYLADALVESGCENETILAHCRLPEEHARGCWVIDGLLGKE